MNSTERDTSSTIELLDIFAAFPKDVMADGRGDQTQERQESDELAPAVQGN